MSQRNKLYQFLLSIIPVSHLGLTNSGFINIDADYHCAGLVIFGGDGYYYFAPNADRVKIKNMKQVSDLVFGKTPYLVMA